MPVNEVEIFRSLRSVEMTGFNNVEGEEQA